MKVKAVKYVSWTLFEYIDVLLFGIGLNIFLPIALGKFLFERDVVSAYNWFLMSVFTVVLSGVLCISMELLKIAQPYLKTQKTRT